MLTLPIKKQWFDMILNGTKTEEYREIKPFYTSRFKNIWGYPAYYHEQHSIILRNGYSKNSEELLCNCSLAIRTGREEWGAIPNKKYYVLILHEVFNLTELKKLPNPKFVDIVK